MKLKKFIPCAVISFFLVFIFIGISTLFTVRHSIDYSPADKIIRENDFSSKVHAQLQEYFEHRYSVTGIPADVYMKSVTKTWVSEAIYYTAKHNFRSLSSNQTFQIKTKDDCFIWFDRLDQDIADYANSLDVEKGEAFDIALAKITDDAHREIIKQTDVFRFNVLRSHGVMGQLEKGLKKIDITFCTVALFILSGILAFVLLKLNRGSKLNTLYWCGISLMISAVIVLIPCIYLNATNYFDSFVISQPQVYTAFTTYMYGVVNFAIVTELIIMTVGFAMLIGYGFANLRHST